MTLDELKDRHTGETAYVLGSGTTVEFYNPEFFADKLLVATNESWCHWLPRVDYMVTKYHPLALQWADSDRVGTMVVTRGLRGHRNLEPITDDRMVVVDHNENTVDRWDGEWPEQGLVATHSSITTAMHLSAVLGCRFLVMVGADCGTLDDDTNLKGHVNERDFADEDVWRKKFESFDRQNQKVADILRKKYGMAVMSMLPFVTPNMEGHRFVSHAGALNV